MKRVFSVAIFIVLMLMMSACEKVVDASSSAVEPTTVSIEKDSVKYTLTLQKNVFARTDSLFGSFEVHNISDTTITFHFGNQQQFGFSISDDAGAIRLFVPEIVLPATSMLVLQKNESKIFTIQTTLADRNGTMFENGPYIFSGYLTEGNSPSLFLSITIR